MSKFFKISIYLLLSVAGLVVIVMAAYFFLINRAEPTTYQKPADNLVPNKTNSQSQTGQKILSTDYHVYQTFNNCAPAALSMALSYFGVNASQEDLANDLRPNHNLTGQNDDKSTPPNELAAKAKDYGLVAYYRPAGDIEKLKALINLDLPIVVRTLLYPDQDYAHYRVIKGYDGTTNEIIQDDSLEGKNLRFTYQEFERLWQPFNNAYLVIARPEQQAAIEKILGEDLTENIAWQKAVTLAQNQLNQDPTDINTNLNLAVANYYLGDFTGSVSAFEKVAANLPKHFLWYQNEPIKAYLALRQYDKVFALTDKIFADNNKADSELYLLRGQSYLAQDQKDEARAEFEKAVFYNKNYLPAQEALSSLDDD